MRYRAGAALWAPAYAGVPSVASCVARLRTCFSSLRLEAFEIDRELTYSGLGNRPFTQAGCTGPVIPK